MRESFEFGRFRLDPHERLLLRDGNPVPLNPRTFEVLVALVIHAGSLLEKDELLETVWHDVAVEESNLAVAISHLRKALGDDRGRHEFIETVQRHGYRFVAAVSRTPAVASGLAEESPHSGRPGVRDDAPLLAPPSPSGRRLARRSEAALGILIACLVFLAWWAAHSGGVAVAKSDAIHSLAILPFQNLGDSASDNYLSEGTADELVSHLGRLSSVVVRPSTALTRYRNSPINPISIGKEQAVDAVLAGRMQREGDRVRLTVQLLRVRDGAVIWADSFDEKFTDIFTLEDEISERVVHSLRIQLSVAEERRLAHKPTENTSAYDAYLKGRYFWNKRTTASVEHGLSYFQDAVRMDPKYANGYEGIADSYAILGRYGALPPQVAFSAARRAAEKALSLDNSLAEAHATLGLIDFYYDWDGPAAENEFERAIDIKPDYAMAHAWSGEVLAAMGHFSEAVTQAEQAVSDDPLSLIVNSDAGWTFLLAGHSQQAVQILKKAIELDPTFPRTHYRLGLAYQATGDDKEAIEQFNQAVHLSGGDVDYEAALAGGYAQAGHRNEARRLLAQLQSRSTRQYVPSFGIALAYSGLNEKENALLWLHRASADHSTSMAFAKVDPLLQNLRSDSKFDEAIGNLRF